ncbi:hypothetical protein CI610_00372 [invertebrate metagenome]|uniref:ATP synthase protein I n=1 Tax=invertebrate metagenome TaxID=1711999 RepID=A0A2H9TBR1_9ZZZZ
MSDSSIWKYKLLSPWQRHARSVSKEYPYLRRPAVYRVVVTQAIIIAVLALIAAPVGKIWTVSVCLGGLCACVPHTYFIWKAFYYRGARAARQITASFYQGEAGKFVLTIAMFMLVFTQVKPIEPLALLGAYIMVQSVQWFTPLLIKT